MVMSYVLANLVPNSLGRRGFLLTISSSNNEENLTGYATLYDCTAADLNPIGSLGKNDI